MNYPPPSVVANEIALNPCFLEDAIHDYPTLRTEAQTAAISFKQQRLQIASRLQNYRDDGVRIEAIEKGHPIPSLDREEPLLVRFVLDTCIADVKRVPHRSGLQTSEVFDAIAQCMADEELYNGIEAKTAVSRQGGLYDLVMRQLIYSRQTPDNRNWLGIVASAAKGTQLPSRKQTTLLPEGLVVGRGYQNKPGGRLFTRLASAAIMYPAERRNDEERIMFAAPRGLSNSPFRT